MFVPSDQTYAFPEVNFFGHHRFKPLKKGIILEKSHVFTLTITVLYFFKER